MTFRSASHINWIFILWYPFLFTNSPSFTEGAWILMWVQSMHPITPGKCAREKFFCFVWSVWWSLSKWTYWQMALFNTALTLIIHLCTVILETPNTSPITSWKLPVAKKRKAIIICMPADRLPKRRVGNSSSCENSSIRARSSFLGNLNRLNSSSSVYISSGLLLSLKIRSLLNCRCAWYCNRITNAIWNSNLHSRATVRRGVGHDCPSPDDDANSDSRVTVVDAHDTQ